MFTLYQRQAQTDDNVPWTATNQWLGTFVSTGDAAAVIIVLSKVYCPAVPSDHHNFMCHMPLTTMDHSTYRDLASTE
jgi:hypothetical protein